MFCVGCGEGVLLKTCYLLGPEQWNSLHLWEKSNRIKEGVKGKHTECEGKMTR